MWLPSLVLRDFKEIWSHISQILLNTIPHAPTVHVEGRWRSHTRRIISLIHIWNRGAWFLKSVDKPLKWLSATKPQISIYWYRGAWFYLSQYKIGAHPLQLTSNNHNIDYEGRGFLKSWQGFIGQILKSRP